MLTATALLACFSFLVAADDAEATFHRAYYLEVEEQKPEAAARLYEAVTKAADAPAALAERARSRLRSCREQVRASDLAGLMPPDVLAYVEVRRPGEHLARLLQLAGLARREGESAAGAGDASDEAGGPPPFLVSPRLLAALEGIAGAAVAITDWDPRQEIPRGVAVLNPGRDDLLHGMIETALSGAVAANQLRPGAPVSGHASYAGPFGAVVVTERLIIAGNPREIVEETVRRLEDGGLPSLGGAEAFAEAGSRREGGLVFAFVNAKRGLEMVKQEMSRGGQLPEEYPVLQALADVESLRWAALKVGTSGEGITGDVWLRLDEGNHSLAYHLLRTPPLSREALKAVPSGAACVLAMAFSEDRTAGSPAEAARTEAAPYVTGLDFGREIFANVKDAVAFVLPPSGAAPEGSPEGLPGGGRGGPGRLPIPDAGLVFVVKDPARSKALWSTLLSIPAAITGLDPSSMRTVEVDGREVRSYVLPGQVQVYLAALPDRVIVATTKAVLTRSFAAAGGKESILEDAGLARVAGTLTGDTSKLVLVHAARAWQAARPFAGMSAAEAEKIAALLEGTTISIMTGETPASFRASAVAGLPRLGALIRELTADGRGPRAGVTKKNSLRSSTPGPSTR